MLLLSLAMLLASLLAACQTPDPADGPSTGAAVEPAASAAPSPSARGGSTDVLGGVMDRLPGRRTPSPDGRWEAIVEEGGALFLRPAGDSTGAVALDTAVDPRVAFSADTLVYTCEGPYSETQLWRVRLPPVDGATNGAPAPGDGAALAKLAPERILDWPGSNDRPVFSPDGDRLAFVSGRTGLASWWVVDLDVLPVPADAGRQLTNVGVENAPHAMGQAPAGFVPAPDGPEYIWSEAGLSWVAEGARHTVVP